MSDRIQCLDCKDILKDPGMYNFATCQCKGLYAQRISKGFAIRMGGNYALVDDQGNVIVPQEIERAPDHAKVVVDDEKPLSNDEKMKELMLGLSHQIEAMQNFSQGGRFSPALNQDLLAHFEWLQAYLRLLSYRIETDHCVNATHLSALENAISAKMKQLDERIERLQAGVGAVIEMIPEEIEIRLKKQYQRQPKLANPAATKRKTLSKPKS